MSRPSFPSPRDVAAEQPNVAGNDDLFLRIFFDIQAQIFFALEGVGPMARETAIR